jgi:hypothetical protein
MTFVGKLVVILQIALSVLFMAFAAGVYAVQTNWKTVADKSEADNKKLQTTLSDTQVEFEKHKTEAAARIADAEKRATRAEGINTGLQRQNKTLTNTLELTTTERDNARSLSTISAEEAKVRREEALTEREINAKLYDTQDELVAGNRNLRDKLFSEVLKVGVLAAKHEVLLEDAALLRKVVRANGLDTDRKKYADDTEPPPVVSGLVLNTKASKRNEIEFAEISIGSNDGLAEGHVLFVYRSSGKYLGKIKIVYVDPDKAVGTVMIKAKNGIIQRGDNVTTKL